MDKFYKELKNRLGLARKNAETASRIKTKNQQFQYKPFSKKQKQVLSWWAEASPVKDKEGIVADGSIRAGKTLSMSLSFGLWSMSQFDGQNFLLCGKTIGSLRRNVINTWKRQMHLEGFRVKDNRYENRLIVSKGETVNNYYLFGGRDERSQDLIQGITAAGALFDEVALMPESFVNQATGRCSVEGSKFWFNCNPEGPFHWFKTKWLDRIPGVNPLAEFTEDNPAKDLLHIHFTMDDNLSLSERTKKSYKTRYSGVFFKRFILGLWVVASGIIYDVFDKGKHTYKDAIVAHGRKYIAVDYGTVNPTVFLAVDDNDPMTSIEREYYYDSRKTGKQKSDKEYGDDFDAFIAEWGHRPRRVVIDPAAASFALELRNRGYNVKNADNEVLDGIRKVASLITLGFLRIHESCINTIAEFHSYTWDAKAAESGTEKPIKQQDHAMDAVRYFVNTILKKRRFSKR